MTSDVGNETKADMKGAGVMGARSTVGESSLMHAVRGLKAEHPQRFDDLGPHHGGMEHVRHMPLGGLRPGGK